uniref:Uncharacterized protein n=1 Tax=Setaria italica TaxID=4555 RepID=K4AI42_SETIT
MGTGRRTPAVQGKVPNRIGNFGNHDKIAEVLLPHFVQRATSKTNKRAKPRAPVPSAVLRPAAAASPPRPHPNPTGRIASPAHARRHPAAHPRATTRPLTQRHPPRPVTRPNPLPSEPSPSLRPPRVPTDLSEPLQRSSPISLPGPLPHRKGPAPPRSPRARHLPPPRDPAASSVGGNEIASPAVAGRGSSE